MRRLSFFQYGAIKFHRDGSVRQRPVPECTLASSVRRGHPGPAPRETRGEAAGPAARPRDGPPCGEAEPQRGRPGRSLRGEEAGRALLRSPAFTQKPPCPSWPAGCAASPRDPRPSGRPEALPSSLCAPLPTELELSPHSPPDIPTLTFVEHSLLPFNAS